jgi:hypothetical protein
MTQKPRLAPGARGETDLTVGLGHVGSFDQVERRAPPEAQILDDASLELNVALIFPQELPSPTAPRVTKT